MATNQALAPTITVGVVQTSLDPQSAWSVAAKMEKVEEDQAIAEVKAFLTAFHDDGVHPDIIVLPELAVPLGFKSALRRMADRLESVIIAGFDYQVSSRTGEVRNEAVLIVPRKWRGKRMGPHPSLRHIGKTYAAPEEEKKLKSIGHSFKGDSSVWLFDGGDIGTFGVLVCYDFLDLERMAMYKGRIHHLFILALNKDATSFTHVAEAVARMVFCNVVICNCGHFGGSLAVSPYRLSERRTIYHHAGPRLATAQLIELPVLQLDEHQRGGFPQYNGEKAFKSLPPGYRASLGLVDSLIKLGK